MTLARAIREPAIPMSRGQMLSIIRAHADAEFQGEIRHHLHGVEREDGERYDELTALIDANDIAESNADAPLLRRCREALIAVGFYRVMPADEIARSWVSRGAVWAFKLKGVPYTSDFTYWDFEERAA